MASKLYFELRKICSASLMEVTQLKTSLAKYSIEFNDLAVQMRPHRIAYLRLLGRPYTLLYVGRSVGRLGGGHHYSKVDLPRSKSNSQDTRWDLNSGRNSHSTLSNTIPPVSYTHLTLPTKA